MLVFNITNVPIVYIGIKDLAALRMASSLSRRCRRQSRLPWAGRRRLWTLSVVHIQPLSWLGPLRCLGGSHRPRLCRSSFGVDPQRSGARSWGYHWSLSCDEEDRYCRRVPLALKCDPCSGLNHAGWDQGLQSQPVLIAVQPLLGPLCFLRSPFDFVHGQLTPIQMIWLPALEETSTLQSLQPALASSSCTPKSQTPAHQSRSACFRHSLPFGSPTYAVFHVYSSSPSSPATPSSKPYSIYHLWTHGYRCWPSNQHIHFSTFANCLLNCLISNSDFRRRILNAWRTFGPFICWKYRCFWIDQLLCFERCLAVRLSDSWSYGGLGFDHHLCSAVGQGCLAPGSPPADFASWHFLVSVWWFARLGPCWRVRHLKSVAHPWARTTLGSLFSLAASPWLLQEYSCWEWDLSEPFHIDNTSTRWIGADIPSAPDFLWLLRVPPSAFLVHLFPFIAYLLGSAVIAAVWLTLCPSPALKRRFWPREPAALFDASLGIAPVAFDLDQRWALSSLLSTRCRTFRAVLFDFADFYLLAQDIGSWAGHGLQALEPLDVPPIYLILPSSLQQLLHHLLAFSVVVSGLWFSWWRLCLLCSASFRGWRSCRLVSQALPVHVLFWASAHQLPWPPLSQRLRSEYLVSTAMPSPICWPGSFLLNPRVHERCSKFHVLVLISFFLYLLMRIYPFSENYPLCLPRLRTLSLLLWVV